MKLSRVEEELLLEWDLVVESMYDAVTEKEYFYISGSSVSESMVYYYRSIREAYDNYFSNWPKKECMDLYRDINRVFNELGRKRLID